MRLMASSRPASLRALPAVETLLGHPLLAAELDALPRALVVDAVRAVLDDERKRLRSAGRSGRAAGPDGLAARAAEAARRAARPTLRRVLNATGIVLHTNLGRAPLAPAACEALEAVARGYASLEFDLESGRRGQRGLGVEAWMRRLTGAEAALVVNNGAAAVLVTLSALASGGAVIVSRGELVEIGGSFRIPEILEKSGARLVEVGTTNRTHLRDYERALDRHDDVAAVLRVHPSNFRVAGFTARPVPGELARVTHRHRVPLIEDLGSGAFVDLAPFGLEHEPTVRESLTAGCDVVTFSGDKLLGASQAGFVVGRKRYVDRVRRDPLARAVRVDKLTLAALEATLPAYCVPDRAVREIPALVMLRVGADVLERRAQRLARALETGSPGVRAEVEEASGEVGGGALPLQRLPGRLVSVTCPGRTAGALEAAARAAEPPVIGYIRGGALKLDVRTLTDAEADETAAVLSKVFAGAMDGGAGDDRPA